MTSLWSYEDKARLLTLLKKYGASDYNLIQSKMPDKSVAEIRFICEKHIKLALSKWCLEETQKPIENQAVNNWLHIMKQINITQRGPVHDVIPRILKYIALFENRVENSYISLSDCYIVLSDISNGLASKHLDEISNHFFFECLTKLAEALKNGEIRTYKNFLKELNNINSLLQDQSINRKTAMVLNPLNVPENLLKMTDVDKLVNILE